MAHLIQTNPENLNCDVCTSVPLNFIICYVCNKTEHGIILRGGLFVLSLAAS